MGARGEERSEDDQRRRQKREQDAQVIKRKSEDRIGHQGLVCLDRVGVCHDPMVAAVRSTPPGRINEPTNDPVLAPS